MIILLYYNYTTNYTINSAINNIIDQLIIISSGA